MNTHLLASATIPSHNNFLNQTPNKTHMHWESLVSSLNFIKLHLVSVDKNAILI